MNRNGIRKFAASARDELISQVGRQAVRCGIDPDGSENRNSPAAGEGQQTDDETRQRLDFIDEVKRKGFGQAVEEAAYNWFTRLVALRYMEANGFLASGIRVFSDASGAFSPESLKNGLLLTPDEPDEAKDGSPDVSADGDELHRQLLFMQCNALSTLLPEVFDGAGACGELLMPEGILDPDGVIAGLVGIPDENWREGVQIIGWLHQYYNTAPKQAVSEGLKKNAKVTRENTPAATQLFTPDWIVRYLVENSLGRLWLESHPDSPLKADWKYCIDEARQTTDAAKRLEFLRRENAVQSPEDMRLIDPCTGGGHILVYAFDVLMQIYVSEGYERSDAVRLILEKNLFGLDIDPRARRLACFSLLMEARRHSRMMLSPGIRPQVFDPEGYPEGMEFGSLARAAEPQDSPAVLPDVSGSRSADSESMANALDFCRLLTQKYDVVVTNPPYLGSRGMSAGLSEYLRANYPDSMHDLFAAFIERCGELLKPYGYQAMITQQAWMFLKGYAGLRKKLLGRDIVNLLHLGSRVFDTIRGEIVQTSAFVISACGTPGYAGTYVRLVQQGKKGEKETAFLKGENRHTAVAGDFAKIPGSPVAYWISPSALKAFSGTSVKDFAKVRHGLTTTDNEAFFRLWFEVELGKSSVRDPDHPSRHKWIPVNKGGGFRKWYGNNEWVINYENDGLALKERANDFYASDSRSLQNHRYFFRKSLTWSALASAGFSVRSSGAGFVFGAGGYCAFPDPGMEEYLLALLNSSVARLYLSAVSATVNHEVGHIKAIPVIVGRKVKADVGALARANTALARADWDSFETSWDFARHPLLFSYGLDPKTMEALVFPEGGHLGSLDSQYDMWRQVCDDRFSAMKENEEELNRILIGVYGLRKELSPGVEDRDITVRKADMGREIRSLISYAVGCMFGRYSLDQDGIVHAGGKWDIFRYKTIPAASDNIIPVCDEEYFSGDMTARFIGFVREVFGERKLEDNLEFIAGALGGKGGSRMIIRNYFLNGFYADHLKIYRKRPVYWMFDSGEKNGFKALIYMHRYSGDLLARLHKTYVLEQQERYITDIARTVSALEDAKGAERVRLTNKLEKLSGQLEEIREFEDKIRSLAEQGITINLDDGVRMNYGLFGDVLAEI